MNKEGSKPGVTALEANSTGTNKSAVNGYGSNAGDSGKTNSKNNEPKADAAEVDGNTANKPAEPYAATTPLDKPGTKGLEGDKPQAAIIESLSKVAQELQKVVTTLMSQSSAKPQTPTGQPPQPGPAMSMAAIMGATPGYPGQTPSVTQPAIGVPPQPPAVPLPTSAPALGTPGYPPPQTPPVASAPAIGMPGYPPVMGAPAPVQVPVSPFAPIQPQAPIMTQAPVVAQPQPVVTQPVVTQPVVAQPVAPQPVAVPAVSAQGVVAPNDAMNRILQGVQTVLSGLSTLAQSQPPVTAQPQTTAPLSVIR